MNSHNHHHHHVSNHHSHQKQPCDDEENYCPNNNNISICGSRRRQQHTTSSLKSSTSTASSSTTTSSKCIGNKRRRRVSSTRKKQQHWPSVKQICAHYETVPTNDDNGGGGDDNSGSGGGGSMYWEKSQPTRLVGDTEEEQEDDDEYEEEVKLTPQKVYVPHFDGRSLKSDQTVLDDEDTVVASGATALKSSDDENPTLLNGTIICLSRLALMGLTLFEIRHRYYSQSQSSFVTNIGTFWWQRVLHLGLVFALFVKATYKSFEASLGKYSQPGVGKARRCRQVVYFVGHLMLWSITIPLFAECRMIGVDNTSFFSSKLVSQLGRCAPGYSIIDIVVANSYHAIVSLLKSIVKGKLLNQVWKEIQRALYNPFQFHARVQKGLVLLRWFRYIGPLIGTCNKLRGNLIDTMKKRRQHRISKAARERWYYVIDAILDQSKSEQAVIQLQKAFRERRVEKARKRQQLLLGNRRWIQKKLEEEERLTRVKLEQIELRDIDRQQRRQVSFEERRGIVMHRETSRRAMKRLLLNPKNYFSSIWKYLTVSCVILEVLTILFAPVLSGDVRKMPLDQFIVRVLLGSGEQCNNQRNKGVASSVFVPAITSINDLTCSASKVKETWFVVAHTIATMLVPIVNCICFLDVFITFFTGELDDNGTLLPKPFFQRWVLPGPFLQLLVNPTMASIKKRTILLFAASINVGPSLCMHCILANRVFAAYIYDRIFYSFLDIVEKVNKFNTDTIGQEEGDDLQWG